MTDHTLIYAYQRYVDTTCHECGGYTLECRDPANRNVYVASTDIYCHRKAAIDEVTKAENFKPESGQLLSVAPVDEDLVTLPGFLLYSDSHTPEVPEADQGEAEE